MTVLETAIKTYGKDMQLNVAIEEFSELIKEICKNKRGRENLEGITEEIADCYIMLEQLLLIFGIENDEINRVIGDKLDRLSKRIENGA